ncbi:hypothetical protein [Brevibacillus daliensis]|uniref:hypothetical protein n=1 Tax=Brevibacillus daliensis TaxID=2892995 RepID=UPI001E52BE8F|nr:hypothetical protein [Brevibacillus daliensis]
MADFQEQFQLFLSLCTEEYVIKHANKGLYNRAIKDMEKGVQVVYTFHQDHVVCTLNDGAVCTLTNHINSYSCSCPSDKICKHVLIAILYYKEHNELEVESKQADYSWLLTQSLQEIQKNFTGAQIEEVLFRILHEEELEVSEGSFLTVKLNVQGIEVSFVEEADCSKSICSCRQNESCIHRLEALLRYRMMHGDEDFDLLYQAGQSVEYSSEVIQDCKQILTEVITLGLAKLPQTICSRLEVLAIAAHNGNLPTLEKGLRSAKGELELFLKRHVRFSQEVFLEKITQMYMSIVALEKEGSIKQKKQLIGSFKSKYYLVPRLRLYALGANPWETRSSYRGITYYFYSLDNHKIYTFTESRPVYYDDATFSFKDYYGKQSPWGKDITMKSLSGAQFQLKGCKVNRERRLSSNEETRLELQERIPIEEIDLSEYLVTNWMEKSEEDEIQLFQERRDNLVILKVAMISSASFNSMTQNLDLVVEDAEQNQLTLTIPYNQEWESNVKFLEKSKRLLELRDLYILVQKYDGMNYPISILKEDTISNLKLDLLK